VLTSLFPISSYNFLVQQAAKGIRDGYDTLVDVFECIENFLMRLMNYARPEIKPTPAMSEILIKILTEFVSILALVTKWMNEGRISKFCPFWKLSFDGRCGREICKEITR
jgi:hypothetical protein